MDNSVENQESGGRGRRTVLCTGEKVWVGELE